MTIRMADAESKTPIMSLSWVSLASVVVLGVVSLLFRARVGTAGLAMIGYMFFRTKAVSSKKPSDEKAEVVTILECPSCDLKRVRDFQRGDYIYKSDEPCTRCEGTMTITGIHRKAEPKKKRYGLRAQET